MAQNDDPPVYEGTIPIEEVRGTHLRILERAEAARNSAAIGGLTAEEVRRTHIRIIEKAEALAHGAKKAVPPASVSATYSAPGAYTPTAGTAYPGGATPVDQDGGAWPGAEAHAGQDSGVWPGGEVPADRGGVAGPGAEPPVDQGDGVGAHEIVTEPAANLLRPAEDFDLVEEFDPGDYLEPADGASATEEQARDWGGRPAPSVTAGTESLPGTGPYQKAASVKTLPGDAPGPARDGAAEPLPLSGRKAARVRLPIAVKLVGVVTALLVLSLGTLTALVSFLVSADVRLTAEDNNFSVNRRTAEAVETRLLGLGAAVTVFYYDLDAIVLTAGSGAEAAERTAARYFFDQNPQIAAITTDGGDFYINETFFANLGADTNMPRLWNAAEGSDLAETLPGTILLRNATPFFGIPMLVMRLPLGASSTNIFFDSETMNAMLGEGDNVSFLLNEQGDVILHRDMDTLRGGANFYQLPFVKNILDNSNTNIQSMYTDGEGVEYFGAVQRLSTGNSVLITIIRTSTVFDGIVKTNARNIALSLTVLLVSIIFIILFSRTISRPLRSLTSAVKKIEDGNYDLQLKVTSNDELGLLTQNFIGMGNSLENFEKFTNRAIVKLAKQGRLSRSGENKKTTVCFAFIRDFHQVADGLDAEAVVDFVNDYLRMMVPCITKNGGSVDKFLTQGGVIIMALWGTPETAGSPKQDALNCMRAVLSMRAALRCLNKNRTRRLGSYIPLVKLGCGINTGEIVAGQIGGEERMEYTVIGDAVNIAARIEGPNDLFDTDILISEETYRYVGDYLLANEMLSIEVKGKEKPLRIFAVVNMRDPVIAKAMLDDLKDFNDVDIEVCKKSVGPEGPRNMGDVRRMWQVKP
ncbi:MAG: HAMP domain-containing protein [Spirochaetaceae bacterium]|jgi:adenylate cyclase|nr:HAMP domain-containing protein [Spirochaetaceae bacterium]